MIRPWVVASATALALVLNLLPAALADVSGDACEEADSSALLQQQRRAKTLERARRDASALAGKSVYFLLVDRFARDNGNDTACANNHEEHNAWCGGTLKGATEHLDFIKGMGFDCVWITPVVKQYPDSTPSGTGAMGYWARDLYQIDPNFGTPEDYKAFIAGLHARDMCIMQDFVANHMGPIHSSKDVEPMNPFNKPEYFNQHDIGDMTFDEYTQKKGGWPPPAQAMWSQSGAQCTTGKSCMCYKCQEEANLLGLPDSYGCKGTRVFDPESPCPEGILSDFCKPGDYQCEGYNETVTERGWFYDLGDLNQTHPFVRSEQLKWIKWFVKEYDIDVLRLDTAAFMSFDFLSELQEAAGVPIIGEVTATNLTYHAQFEAYPTKDDKDVLAGVLNFPLYFTAIAAFCHTWFPFSQGNMTFLGERMHEQVHSGLYKNLDTLGNFPDNHDVPRIMLACNADKSRVKNTIAWTMMSKGLPIIYYGTEVLMTWERESFWSWGWDTTTPMYRLLTALNKVRSDYGLALADMEVVPTADERTLVFKRGSVWVFVNNLEETGADVPYCGELPAEPEEGMTWVEALHGGVPAVFKGGCYWASGSEPHVLAPAPAGSR